MITSSAQGLAHSVGRIASRRSEARITPLSIRARGELGEDMTVTPAGRSAGPSAAPQAGDLTDELINTDWWTDQLVQAAGIPIVDVPFVSLGGGIGSFVTVDYLRIAGVPVEQHPGAVQHRPPVADL